MDSEFADTKRSCQDHKVVILEEGSGTHRSPAPRFLYAVGLLSLCLIFAVVAGQQLQISAMGDKLANLQHELLDDGMSFTDTIIDGANDTEKALLSRSRRQSGGLPRTRTSFVHLQGELTRYRLPTLTSDAYLWIDPTNPRSLSDRDIISNAHVCGNSRDRPYVRAVRVILEGWYYVYAQLPYMSDHRGTFGHKIVKIRNGGMSQALDIMATSLTFPVSESEPDALSRNWQYLGGMVYLETKAHVEVRPMNIDGRPFNEHSADTGAFFGLFLIKENTNVPPISEGC